MSEKSKQRQDLKALSTQKDENHSASNLPAVEPSEVLETTSQTKTESFKPGILEFEWTSQRGPLPGPEVLERYKNLNEELFSQTEKMALAEQEHRHKLERTVTNALKRGQYIAMTISLSSLLLAGVLLFNGQQIGGVGSLIFALANLVAPLLYRKRIDD